MFGRDVEVHPQPSTGRRMLYRRRQHAYRLQLGAVEHDETRFRRPKRR